ncbi:MAG: hypothetical protein GY821_12990 [Gammaproteobacteria bacterium]|nr:hypothetical protein [Gammaproteobacteria bacterium]
MFTGLTLDNLPDLTDIEKQDDREDIDAIIAMKDGLTLKSDQKIALKGDNGKVVVGNNALELQLQNADKSYQKQMQMQMQMEMMKVKKVSLDGDISSVNSTQKMLALQTNKRDMSNMETNGIEAFKIVVIGDDKQLPTSPTLSNKGNVTLKLDMNAVLDEGYKNNPFNQTNGMNKDINIYGKDNIHGSDPLYNALLNV